VHVALPLVGVGHTLPHAPQLSTSALSFTQVPPQLAKPALQPIPHAPAVHVGDPLAGVAQTLPHAPQL
jgi:hypothetical protein